MEIKRQTAYKILIKEILDSPYNKQEGWNPNYIETGRGKISRVNIFGFVIEKEGNSITIDDSTGNIQVRAFDESKPIQESKIGDLVLVIGKPREFNDQKYVAPDIIRKYDNPDWLKLRLKELGNPMPIIEEEKELSSYDKIMTLIENNDEGEGVSVDRIIIESKLDNCEKIIESLLKEGEIFEIRPGIVKSL